MVRVDRSMSHASRAILPVKALWRASTLTPTLPPTWTRGVSASGTGNRSRRRSLSASSTTGPVFDRGSRLDQRAVVDEPLRDDARKRGKHPRVVLKRAELVGVRLRGGGGGFGGGVLCRGIVQVLLRHQVGLVLVHLDQALVIEMCDRMLGLGAARRGAGALELVLELGDLEGRQQIARLDAVADVHPDRVHVARHLCVDQHVLVRIELPLERH